MLTNALGFLDVKDTEGLRLYYEYISAGMAAFIIKWVVDSDLSDERAVKLLSDILLQVPVEKARVLRKLRAEYDDPPLSDELAEGDVSC